MRVMYEPPKFENKPLTPAEIGTLVDEKLDPRDITSSIVGLAVKGYLTIEETKKEGLILDKEDYYLRKLKEPDAELTSFETELMKSFSRLHYRGVCLTSEEQLLYESGQIEKTPLRRPGKEKVFSYQPGEGEKFLLCYRLSDHGLRCRCGWGPWPLFIYEEYYCIRIIGLPVLGFAWFMPAKTKAGAGAYMDILGSRSL